MKSKMIIGAIWGVIVGILICLLLSGVISFLINGERFSEENVFWLGLGITLLSTLAGCIIGTGIYQEKSLFTVALIILGYTLIMMLVGFAVFGNVRNIGFWNVPMSLIAGVAVCIIRAGKGKRKYK